jgi:hypothetical protein
VQLGQFVRHLRICSSNPTDPPANQDTDPEDGFDDDIESRLVSRSGHGVNDWATLYTLLFGATEQIPWPGRKFLISVTIKQTKLIVARL